MGSSTILKWIHMEHFPCVIATMAAWQRPSEARCSSPVAVTLWGVQHGSACETLVKIMGLSWVHPSITQPGVHLMECRWIAPNPMGLNWLLVLKCSLRESNTTFENGSFTDQFASWFCWHCSNIVNIYIYVCIYIYMIIYVYVCICMYRSNYQRVYFSFTPKTHRSS